jgi:hypothetical protein
MIKRAMVLAGLGLAAACVTTEASARGVDVGVFVNVPGPVYAAPPVIYQPPPVVYAPQPVYGGYGGYGGYYPGYGGGRGWHDHGRHRGWEKHHHRHGD